MKDSDTKLPYRRKKRKVSYGSFYGTFKDTRFNVAFERPSFGPHVKFGETERQQEVDLWGNEEDISKIRAMKQEKGMVRVRKK